MKELSYDVQKQIAINVIDDLIGNTFEELKEDIAEIEAREYDSGKDYVTFMEIKRKAEVLMSYEVTKKHIVVLEV